MSPPSSEQQARAADDHTPTSVRVACVLYNNRLDEVWRCLRALFHTSDRALADPALDLSVIRIELGDGSSRRLITERDLVELRNAAPERVTVDYTWFRRNLHHSAGCNALAADAKEDAILFLNPDTYVAPTLLETMLRAMDDVRVAAVDARQIPCEHPKWFDPVYGDQSWASGACLLVRSGRFAEVGGFDAETFPSYVNDVDLSWRLRLNDGRVVHEPRAVVFHDKRLTPSAEVLPTASEVYAGTLARLLLATKFDRADVAEQTVAEIEQHGEPEHRRALAEFRRRQSAKALPGVLTGSAAVAEFTAGEYGRRRF